MSLLAGLRAMGPDENGESPWQAFKTLMPLMVPGFELTKLETHGDGRVAMRGKSPMGGQGRYYLVLTMDGVRDSRPDGTREVRLGVARYRDEADAMLYDNPHRAFVDPAPTAVVAWLTGVLHTENPYSAPRG